MDALIDSGISYTKKKGGDNHEEYGRKHRARCKPARIDGQPEKAPKTIFQFHGKEFNEVLNMEITSLGDNLAVCLSIVEPIAKVLQLPLLEAKLGDVVKMVKLQKYAYKNKEIGLSGRVRQI